MVCVFDSDYYFSDTSLQEKQQGHVFVLDRIERRVKNEDLTPMDCINLCLESCRNFIEFSMLSMLFCNIWKCQKVIFYISYINLTIDGFFPLIYKQYMESFPSILTVSENK